MEWHELTFFLCYNAWGLRWKAWKLGHGIIWRFIPSSVRQVLRVSWGRSWGFQRNTAGGLYLWHWVSSQNGGWAEAVTVMAVFSCCGLHGPRLSLSHRAKWGWGKRFTAASRPGRFQSRHCFQWAAVTRALEFCETQPWASPWAPQLTCSKVRFWKALGRRQRPAARHTVCPEDHCKANWTRTLPR